MSIKYLTAILFCLAFASCWIIRPSQVYPVRDHYKTKVRAYGNHTAWLADHQHWVTVEHGRLVVINDTIDQGPPMPVGFYDAPLRISVATVGGDYVWIPYIDVTGVIHVIHSRMRNSRVIEATLPARAFGAPVLYDCKDAFACDGGQDAVVGVVTGWTPKLHTRIATLPELSDFVVANNLDVYLNKGDIPGESMSDMLGDDMSADDDGSL